jgi:hypothetical protein
MAAVVLSEDQVEVRRCTGLCIGALVIEERYGELAMVVVEFGAG